MLHVIPFNARYFDPIKYWPYPGYGKVLRRLPVSASESAADICKKLINTELTTKRPIWNRHATTAVGILDKIGHITENYKVEFPTTFYTCVTVS